MGGRHREASRDGRERAGDAARREQVGRVHDLTSGFRSSGSAAYAGAVSIHRGTIINNVDPAIRGRIQVRVPSVSPEASAWAIPVLPLGVLAPAAPAPIGAAVWVMYEDDD